MTSLIDEDVTADLTADLTAELTPQQPSVQAAQRPQVQPQQPPSHQPAQPPIAPAVTPPRVRSTAATLTKGSTLRERYVLEEAIANGGTSVIFRARDLRRTSDATPAHVAVKVLRPDLHTNPSAIERLKREFRHAQSLSHPNIVRVLDLDCEGEHWFMTMELLEGESLSALLKQNIATPLPPHRVSGILRACGDALSFAHERGVVHGDFKPGNVFITRKGQVRVLDFGAATSTAPTIEEHFPAATLCYASPEVLSGRKPERRDDIFSFACVAYELLNGKHPFDRHSALEAYTKQLSPARAWNLNDRQWFPLEAGLAFRRDGRPANIRSLVNGLLSSDILPPLVLPLSMDLPSIGSPDISAPPRTPPNNTTARTWISTIVAIMTLALIAMVAYSRVRQSPEQLTELRERMGAWISGNAPPSTPASAPASAQVNGPGSAPLNDPVTLPSSPLLAPMPAAQQPISETPLVPPLNEPRREPSSARAVDSQPAQIRQTKPLPTASAAPRTAASTGPRPIVSFTDASITVSEGAGAAVLTLRREQYLNGRTLLHWRAIPGSALPAQDYIKGAAGLTEFADGHNRRAIYIPLLQDAITETREDFTVELYDAADDAQIWPIARATVKIMDDDH